MDNLKILEIFGMKICDINYDEIIAVIKKSIHADEKVSFSYANVNTLNLIYSDRLLQPIFSSFNYIHADGIGVYLFSKLLKNFKPLGQRISGSDFYPLLIDECIKNNWEIFFFGDTNSTLAKIQDNYKLLKIAGAQNGFEFNDQSIVEQINSSNAQIVIVGLGQPKQEKWIHQNFDKLHTNILFAVGDGIKVFANTKIRGPKLVRWIGLEWIIRLFNDPKFMWKRYLIGIPKFIFNFVNSELKS